MRPTTVLFGPPNVYFEETSTYLKTQEKPCAWHEACSFSSTLTLILANINGLNKLLLLFIIKQVDKDQISV